MILLDTHALVWAMISPSALSTNAKEAISAAELKIVSSVSIYEIRYKYRLGKWPDAAFFLDKDPVNRLPESGFAINAPDGEIMDLAGSLEWHHRDPFDRMIAATAIVNNLPILSKDETLDTLQAPALRRIW